MNSRNNTILRSDCYKLLAACFYEPDKNLLVEERVCENLADLLAQQDPDAGRAAAEMVLALQDLTREQLSIDHAALFIGPFELIAAPYGSVYMDQGRRIMGDSTLGVQRFYQDAGLEVDGGEPADHIVIELEFMYYLAQREAAAMADGLEDDAAGYRQQQLRFLATWLQPWVFEFCRLIRSGTANPFYRSLADCLGRYMISPGSRPALESESERPIACGDIADAVASEKYPD
jgi:TorA maturation chaperone TorD